MKTVAFDLDDLLVNTHPRKEVYANDLKNTDNEVVIRDKYNSGGYLHLDTPLPFAVATVELFDNLGWNIVYITGRRVSALETSINVLRGMGFPINEDNLYFRPMGDYDTPQHKRESFLKIMDDGHDIQYFFDDKEENLEVARSLGIRAVYNSVQPFFAEAINWEI